MNIPHVTVLLVDDHPMMREGTRHLLEEDPTLRVVGEAQNGEEALKLYNSLHPDVVILDIAMKGMNGFTTAQHLREQSRTKPAILVLTAYDQLAYVHTMLKLGVKGYWLKSARGSDIRRAVHDVFAGRQSLDPEIRLLLENDETSSEMIEPLTARELEVLKLIVQGVRNNDISKELNISVKTVETHLTSIYGKLRVQSRAEAIALAQKQRLLLQ